MAEDIKRGMNDSDDGELTALFASLGNVRASDDLVASTLARIESLAAAEAAEGADVAIGTEPASSGSAVPEIAVVSDKRGRTRRKPRFRAIRIAAVAACLVLALSGGVAYALPTSHVMVSQGDVVIDLGVNRFGITVSASSDSEDGKSIISSSDLLHVSYEDSFARAVGAMEADGHDDPIEVKVDSRNEKQAKRLEDANAAVMKEHGEQAAQPAQDAMPENLGASAAGQGQQAGHPEASDGTQSAAPASDAKAASDAGAAGNRQPE